MKTYINVQKHTNPIKISGRVFLALARLGR